MLSISGNMHLSIRWCIVYVNTILCSCTVLEYLPSYHRVTAHVRTRGQSIHHPTSLHNDDTYITFTILGYKTFFDVVVRGLRTRLKICISTGNTVPRSPIGFQKLSCSGVPSIILHNNMIYSISQVSLHCNLYAEMLF